MWGINNYSSLTKWQVTNQEKLLGLPLGLQGNPGLTAPGQGGTIGNADKLITLTAYKLVSTSTLVNKGLNLASTFGVVVPATDFYAGSTPMGTGYDVGAHEWRYPSTS